MNKNDILLLDQLEEVGMRVHVVDYATSMDFNPIGVPLSMHAHIRLNPTHYILTNTGGNKCLDKTKSLDPYESYTKQLCEMKCLDKAIWTGCQCEVMASFIKRNPNTLCSPQQMLQCVYPRLFGLVNDSAFYIVSSHFCTHSERGLATSAFNFRTAFSNATAPNVRKCATTGCIPPT